MKGSGSYHGTGTSNAPVPEHAIHFYSRESLLLRAAVKFLIAALKRGQAAIVLAGPEHRERIVQELKAHRINLNQLRGVGRYIDLDTEEFLSRITVDGQVEADRFARVMGALMVRASSAADGHPAVFGEAMAFLCSRGQTEGAIELEDLWNDLARRHNFSLLCGCVAGQFLDQRQAGALDRVCAAHSEVLPEAEYLDLNDGDRFRYVAKMQQKLRALEAEVGERRHSEEALARSEKLAAMGRLAATIAHEVNSPLMSLTNIIYLLSTLSSLDPQARQYVAMADQELQRAARITKQVLGFYRESPKPVRCTMAQLADDVLELYQPKLVKSNIAVTKNYRVDGAINGYPSEMRQVLANLIGNAIDAIGNHGAIHVRVSETRDWKSPERQGVRISIADSGPGISRENQQSVFHPFFTTKGESGTGLGLWLSRDIVRRHGGRMDLRSRAESDPHGTVFSIALPAAGQKGELPSKLQSAQPWKIAA